MPTEVTTRVATEGMQASKLSRIEPTDSVRQNLPPQEQNTDKSVTPKTSNAPAEGKAIDDAVSRLNDFVQSVKRDLHFKVDDESGRTIIEVIDSETNKVIRQIPSEEIVELARRIEDTDSFILSTQA